MKAMKERRGDLSRLVVLGALATAALALLFAVACGGGGGADGGGESSRNGGDSIDNVNGEMLSLESYFERLSELGKEWEDRVSELALDARVTGDYYNFVRAMSQLLEGFIEDLERMKPPRKTAEVHQELMSNLAGYADVLEDGVSQLKDVRSLSAYSLWVGEREDLLESVVGEKGDAACSELQRLARDAGIVADLEWCFSD